MKAGDLIKDKYYLLNDKYYFRFFNLKDGVIYTNGYFVDMNSIYKYKYTLNGIMILTVNYEYDNYLEVDLKEFIDYLPKNHPEKINYRKQKIKNLLDL